VRRTNAYRGGLAGAVSILVAVLLVASPNGPGSAHAPTPDPATTLTRAQEMRAVCVVALQTSVTSAERARAEACIADMDRVIRSLTGATSAPTSPGPSPTLRPTSPPATVPPSPTLPPAGVFPNPATTGVPLGWTPKETRTTTLRVTTAGAVVQDIRFVNAGIIVDAANVTIRRVEIQGGRIDNVPGSVCRNGMVLEDVSIIRAPNQITNWNDNPAVGHGGYTARRVEVNGLPEAFRVGGVGSSGCGPVTITDTFARVTAPDNCGDWHGDGIQGYDGPALIVRNVTLELIERSGCGGTAPFFYPRNQGNTSATIDRLLVKGGGFAFRDGMPGSVTGLRVAEASYGYGPIDVRCSVVSAWEAQIVKIDTSYRVTAPVRGVACNTEAGT
jgi:hypothetical protein